MRRQWRGRAGIGRKTEDKSMSLISHPGAQRDLQEEGAESHQGYSHVRCQGYGMYSFLSLAPLDCKPLHFSLKRMACCGLLRQGKR